jgi:PhoPQ-activated pathogenicity-related protein
MSPTKLRPHKPCPSSAVLIAALGLSASAAGAATNALEAYVHAPDSKFAWKRVEQSTTAGFAITHLEMTSQKWRDHTWTHHVQIVRPAVVRNTNIAFLYITGDGTGRGSINMLSLLAERAGAVAAVVSQVPNQPLYGGKSEDALIAHTFEQYFKTGDETWPLLFPMTKSAVRAMDAVAAFALREHGAVITNFVVAGMSKRGWTTWLAGAVDPRVKGISPMVIDMLNWKKQIEWAEKVYGKQSEQIHDYTDLNLHLKLDEPRIVNLRSWVDPYSLRNRYTMPKLILLGTNDPYWTVDSLRHYWNELPGPKFIFQTPNGGHGLGDMKDATAALAAFFEMIADGSELPKVTWNFTGKDGSELDLNVTPVAQSTRLFTADSRDRDFRDERWSSRVLQSEPTNKAAGQVLIPTNGYRAFMGEVTLKTPRGHDYKLSTQVRVVPDNIK